MGTDANTATANLLSFQADVQSRMYAALGNDRGSQLIALDAQQAKALADAKAAGYDTTQLQQVQAAERAAKAFQLAQSDVLAAYDQQITAQQDYISGLSNGAVKIAQSARQFRSAFDALALNDNSPLSDLERLNEARRQAKVDYATYKDTTKSDDERDAAKQDLLSMGPTLVQLARSYFGPTDSTDYKWIRSVFTEFGDTTALGVDTAESTLKTANDTLKELQKGRAEAAALTASDASGGTDLYDSGDVPAQVDPRFGYLIHVLPASVTTRSLRLSLSDPTVPELRGGRLFAGPLWTPQRSPSHGYDFGRAPLSAQTIGRAGQTFIDRRANPRATSFTLGLVTLDEERTHLRELQRLCANSDDMLVIFDASDPNPGDVSIWGIAKDLQRPRRDLPGYHSNAFAITERL